jgi:hypothetical protein
MRQQAPTPKNALFAGYALVASLNETCELNGIDPYTYLPDVLSRLVNLWPNARHDELIPWNRAAARVHLQRPACLPSTGTDVKPPGGSTAYSIHCLVL